MQVSTLLSSKFLTYKSKIVHEELGHIERENMSLSRRVNNDIRLETEPLKTESTHLIM